MMHQGYPKDNLECAWETLSFAVMSGSNDEYASRQLLSIGGFYFWFSDRPGEFKAS